MAKKKNVVTIDVKKWCRHAFMNDYGKSCAIQFAQDQGVEISQNYSPYPLTNDKLAKILKKYKVDASIFNEKSSLRNAIMSANDELRGEKRRKVLTELFKLEGISLKFKNLPKKGNK